MSKYLFSPFFLCCFFSSASTANALVSGDDTSSYGSEGTDAIPITTESDSVPSTYGSEASEAVARTSESGGMPSVYGSYRTDAVARTEYSRGIEGGWSAGGFCPEGPRFAGENRGVLPLATDEELGGFTNQQLDSFIAQISREFARELGQLNTRESWVTYFELGDLQSGAPQTPTETISNAQPDAATVNRNQKVVNEVLARLDSTSKDTEFKIVSDSWGFKALQRALREASRPLEERNATVLRAQAKLLNDSLATISTGNDWRTHLKIGNIEQLSQQETISRSENLEEITRRFDGVVQNPTYQMIVQLPGFQGVYRGLHDLKEVRQPQSVARREPSSTETQVRK